MCPIYVYQCEKCNEAFEEEHSIAEREEPLKKPCEKCGGVLFIQLNACGLSFGGCPHKHPPEWFRDKLREMKKKNPGNKINIV
jgi:putative FmdB family regulatory protein